MKFPLAFSLTLTALLCGGCVTPLTVEKSAFPVPHSGKGRIAIATIENRPYVLSGKKTERFEGVLRAMYGIPANLNNFENKRFSDYIGDRVAQGFSNAGYTVTVLSLPQGASDDAVRMRLAAMTSDRGLVMRLNDWRIDWGGFIVPSWQFFYAVDISVYDGKAALLCQRTFSGRDTPPVAGSDSILNNSMKHYQAKFREFLVDRRIAEALQGVRDSEPEPPSLKEQLAVLQALLDSGLVTDGEYAEKKKLMGEAEPR